MLKMATAQKTRTQDLPLQEDEEEHFSDQGSEQYSDSGTETEDESDGNETEEELELESGTEPEPEPRSQRQQQLTRRPQVQQKRRSHREGQLKAMQPFERILADKSMTGPVTYARAMRGEVNTDDEEVEGNANKQVQSQSQNEDKGDESGLKLRLDLNLDIELELKASIHGDVTLSLL